MEELQLHEKFEMEVLNLMHSAKVLDKLIFGGGTMLRLCFGLNRYSVDLDFYVVSGKRFKNDFNKLKVIFEQAGFEVTDFMEKHFTFLVELRSGKYSRRLKIEIRKKGYGDMQIMQSIAFSNNTPTLQVRLVTYTLKQMFENKIEAFLSRSEIRDAFDLEFLLRSGAAKDYTFAKDKAKLILEKLERFSEQDYKNTLGNLLSKDDKEFFYQNKFAYLKAELNKFA
ncbi:nucleotidyl transferase AbiEii/AbiGii toxin family protein [bacterium]|nr:nucleotidyl transferase AbiEii/AbiGii toxin family protein [bacterium]